MIISPSYGFITLFYAFTKPVIFLNTIESIQKVFGNKKTLNRPALKTSTNIGKTLLTLNDNEWAMRRNFYYESLFSVLNSNYIDNLFGEMLSDVIIPHLNKCSQNNELWFPRKYLFHLSFNVVYTALFGKTISFSNIKFNKFNQFSNETINSSAVITLISLMPKLTKIPYFKRIQNEVDLRRFKTCQIIDDWIASNLGYDSRVWNKDESKNPYFKDIKDKASKKTQLFVDKMIYNYVYGSSVTREDVYNEIGFIFISGSDTTGRTGEYGLIYLSKYPALQDLLYNELRNVFKDNSKISMNNNIQKLPLLRAFTKEILRISSVVPAGFPHTVSQDLLVELNGETVVIPKNSIIMANIGYANKYDKYWKEFNKNNVAGDFSNFGEINLNAWLKKDNNGNIEYVNNSNFVSFSYGKRKCVGYALALKELHCLFAHLILNYTFKSQKNVSIKQKWYLVKVIEPQIGLIINKRSN